MTDPWLSLAVEGESDAEVLRVLLASCGLPPPVQVLTVSKPAIVRRIAGYNAAAEHEPWYVQIDLDADYDCAPNAARAWLPEPSRWMVLGVARPELESWLLADRERCARWLGASIANLPLAPDEERDAKRTVLTILDRHGSGPRKRQMLPTPRSGRVVGPEYEAELVRFAIERWRPHEAAKRSPSLARTVERLAELHERWTNQGSA